MTATSVFAQTENETDSTEVDPAEDEGWRVLVAAGAGEMKLDLKTDLPYTYRDPRTGQSVTTAFNLGLTSNGSLSFNAGGLGGGRAATALITNGSLAFAAGYSQLSVNFTSLTNKGTLPINILEGGAKGVSYFGRVEYRYKNSTIFTPYVGYKNAFFQASYKARNVIGYIPGADLYESFPTIDANDGKRTHSGRAGLRIALPIQNWHIGPYFDYADSRYFITLEPGVGTVDTHTGFVPDHPDRLVDAWYYRTDASAYSTGATIGRTTKIESGGFELYMDFRKFLSLSIDGRYNYRQSAWNVTTTAAFFYHPNLGIVAVANYSEPENSQLFQRTYVIGPVATFKF